MTATVKNLFFLFILFSSAVLSELYYICTEFGQDVIICCISAI